LGRSDIVLDWSLALGLLLIAAIAATGGLLALDSLPKRRLAPCRSIFADGETGSVLLFDGEVLVDSTPGGRALLAAPNLRGGAWARLLAGLSPHFPDLDTQLQRLGSEGALTLISARPAADGLLLSAELRGGLTRITVSDAEQVAGLRATDPLVQRAMVDELAQLRDTLAKAPVMSWRETDAGDVVWANAAYLARAAAALPAGQDLSWPLPRLFAKTATDQAALGQRQSVTLPDGGPVWYDLTGATEGGVGRLMFATPADAAVHAETALRDFMQTLTKTFAQLPIGLAIFDRQRQLQLFNPALLDLTGLPVDFLSLRPSLLSVLDALRDRKMIPEPKDYKGWRRQIVDLEKAAASGLYEETWNLPDGQTYRVIGRPHPNGALALMIEDISTEMLRTRRYRAELELSQAVVDAMEESIAVFSQAGQLVMSNAAYAALWGHDPVATLADVSVRTLSTQWRAQSAPNSLWAEVEDFVATVGDRQSWRAEARLLDGRLLACRFSPLAGGATLVSFRPLSLAETGLPRLSDKTAARRARG
jgi:PAS domain-containing protein